MKTLRRREFLSLGALAARPVLATDGLRPILISVNVMFDQGAHSGKGLTETEKARFQRYWKVALTEFATSGIVFSFRVVEDAYLRTQGYSDVPEKFLARGMINLFVTETLGYDLDRDRTGGCSSGPRPRRPSSPPDPFFKTFLGMREAGVGTLPHEYAHHFTLDTLRNPTATGNLWADLRNDYWLWRQRHGAAIPEFRACSRAEWAKLLD